LPEGFIVAAPEKITLAGGSEISSGSSELFLSITIEEDTSRVGYRGDAITIGSSPRFLLSVPLLPVA